MLSPCRRSCARRALGDEAGARQDDDRIAELKISAMPSPPPAPEAKPSSVSPRHVPPEASTSGQQPTEESASEPGSVKTGIRKDYAASQPNMAAAATAQKPASPLQDDHLAMPVSSSPPSAPDLSEAIPLPVSTSGKAQQAPSLSSPRGHAKPDTSSAHMRSPPSIWPAEVHIDAKQGVQQQAASAPEQPSSHAQFNSAGCPSTSGSPPGDAQQSQGVAEDMKPGGVAVHEDPTSDPLRKGTAACGVSAEQHSRPGADQQLSSADLPAQSKPAPSFYATWNAALQSDMSGGVIESGGGQAQRESMQMGLRSSAEPAFATQPDGPVKAAQLGQHKGE